MKTMTYDGARLDRRDLIARVERETRYSKGCSLNDTDTDTDSAREILLAFLRDVTAFAAIGAVILVALMGLAGWWNA